MTTTFVDGNGKSPVEGASRGLYTPVIDEEKTTEFRLDGDEGPDCQKGSNGKGSYTPVGTEEDRLTATTDR